MGRIYIQPHIQKEVSIGLTMRFGQWEPVYYDSYNEDNGKWSFKVVELLAKHHT